MRPDKLKIHLMYHEVINILKTNTYKPVILTSFLLSLFINSFARNDGGIEEKQSAKPLTGSVATTNSFPLEDNQSTVIDYASFPIQLVQQHKKIKNIITFSIDEESEKYISQDFTAIATVLIEYGPNVSQLESITQVFTIDYKKAEGAKYNATQYFHFDNAEYVKITLQSIDAPVIGTLDTKDILLLENEMRITRYYELPANVPAPTMLNYSTPVEAVPDHLKVNWVWPPNTGNNATQMEWSWIEEEMEGNYFVNGVIDYDLVFKNASRVDL